MADNVNPSIVSDESGNNYGGINDYGGDTLQKAQMEYLNNLALLAQNTPPKNISNQDFFPGMNEGIVAGNISTRTYGNTPLIVPNIGVFPFAAFNELKAAKAEAEAKYYQELKSELDKPLFDQKLKLADPWRQPAFSQKVMDTVDKYLDLYTKQFGGDTAKAYIATRNDPNFQRSMQTYAQYVEMYNTVYNKALELEKTYNDKQSGMKVYVPQDAKAAVDRFLYSHENLTNLGPDELLNEAKKLHSVLSATSIAEALTAGYKDQVMQTDFVRSEEMSSEEQDVLISQKLTNKGVAEQIIQTGLDAYPWLKTDSEQKAIFEREVRNRVAFSRELIVDEVKKRNATRDIALQKYGWGGEKEGEVNFQTKPSALVNTVGQFAISYPNDVKPFNTPVGMQAWVVVDGKPRYVKFNESYEMKPSSEYDITEENTGVARGRYVEGKVNFQTQQPYTPQDVRAPIKDGKVMQPVVIGEGRGTTQVGTASVVDVYTGEEIPLFGNLTVLTPYNNMKSILEADIYPLKYVHDKLDKVATPQGARAIYGKGNAIPLTSDMTIDKIDPEKYYQTAQGLVRKGSEIITIYNQRNNTPAYGLDVSR